jgi:hypothetical protein
MAELKAYLKNPPAFILVATLLFHLGILEPSLVSIWLDEGDKLEKRLCFFELAFSLSKVS